MAKENKKKLTDYRPDPLNHNKGSEFGNHLLEKSIQKTGLSRSIVVSADNVVLAGNQTYTKAGEMGFENVIEVPTDGKTLVVVRRTDIQSGTKEFYEAAMADNYVSQHNFVEDANVVEVIAEQYDVQPLDWGAKDTNALHDGTQKGSALGEFGLGNDDDDDDDEEEEVQAGTPTAKEKKELTFPIAFMVNSPYKAKWERFKQLEGTNSDSEAFTKFIDKLEKSL